MEMTSKRKPVSLLDALDHTTNKEGRENTTVGEERVRQELHCERVFSGPVYTWY